MNDFNANERLVQTHHNEWLAGERRMWLWIGLAAGLAVIGIILFAGGR